MVCHVRFPVFGEDRQPPYGTRQRGTSSSREEGAVSDKSAEVQTIVDPKDAAETAGLRYVTDGRPGIRRRKSGKGFTYMRADGSKLTEPQVLKRIKSLAVPPAWTDVWITGIFETGAYPNNVPNAGWCHSAGSKPCKDSGFKALFQGDRWNRRGATSLIHVGPP